MKKTILLLGTLFMFTSCEIEDYNENKKAFLKVTPNSLYLSAQKEFADEIVDMSTSSPNGIFVQYWSEVQYRSSTNYDVPSRAGSIYWTTYTKVLNTLKDAETILGKEEKVLDKENKLAMINILRINAYAYLVETFGAVPYSEAINAVENTTPKYDDGNTIYNDLIKKLSATIESIKTADKGFSNDNIYQGDMSKWKKFGASLLLRMGMTLADVDPTTSKTTVEKAIKYGVFTSNADNANFSYGATAPNQHPEFTNVNPKGTNRFDYIPAKTFINALKDKSDPRLAKWFTKYGNDYKGGSIGSLNDYKLHSHIIPYEATAKGEMLSYAEISFLLADATTRGYATSGTASDFYKAGIKASMEVAGVSSSDINTYVAANAYKDKKSIAYEAWVGLYRQGHAAWLMWRRMDYPELGKADESVIDDWNYPPLRYAYPQDEQSLNKKNYDAVKKTLTGGEDVQNAQIFWDKNKPSY